MQEKKKKKSSVTLKETSTLLDGWMVDGEKGWMGSQGKEV